MFPSVLRRESAITVGLLEAIAVYEIYAHHMPQTVDLRNAAPHNSDAESSRRQAAFESAGLLVLVFAMTRDLNAFILGGVATIAVDMSYKHANGLNPATGKLDASGGGQSISNVYPLDNYDADAG